MARTKSRSEKTSASSGGLLWTILVLLMSSGVGGLTFPDLPIVGPIVQAVAALAGFDIGETTTASGNLATDGSAANASPNSPPVAVPAPATATPPAPSAAPAAMVNRPTLALATYNIQVFGISKLDKPWVVQVLAHTVRQFDIVAIQEIRSKDDSVMPRFLQAVNADGSRYDFIVGPRLGRTSSKEQYAFVYNTSRIEVDPSTVNTIQDPTDLLHREPLVGRFRVRVQPPQAGFSFWLINIHTDPDEAKAEVNALGDLFAMMQHVLPGEDDVILLGDLNINDRGFGRLGQLPGIAWVVTGVPTTTRGGETYDNILFHSSATAEYTGRWGVVDMARVFGLTLEQALEVSDHLPVWAEFNVYEVPPQPALARTPGFVSPPMR